MSKKGQAKNTKNKAKHSKLMNRKKNKLRLEKNNAKERLKELNQRINAQQKVNSSNDEK